MTLRPTVSYERFDVVKMPFPFTGQAQANCHRLAKVEA